MFSVRHVRKDGTESLHEAVLVEKEPAVTAGPEPHDVRVYLVKPDKSGVYISSGKVFVMNDAGSTVASYDFD